MEGIRASESVLILQVYLRSHLQNRRTVLELCQSRPRPQGSQINPLQVLQAVHTATNPENYTSVFCTEFFFTAQVLSVSFGWWAKRTLKESTINKKWNWNNLITNSVAHFLIKNIFHGPVFVSSISQTFLTNNKSFSENITIFYSRVAPCEPERSVKIGTFPALDSESVHRAHVLWCRQGTVKILWRVVQNSHGHPKPFRM
jgi:hypothetical protein